MSPKKLPTRAYSYLRFSSPEQMKGDSLRRQTRLAEEYAASHGLTLDTELNLKDLGVSAYRGDNVENGALGAFRRAIKDRLVPKGSYLLVESLDRVSRKQARKAVRILEEIVEAGVIVVTLNDGKAYTEESLDGADFLIAVILLMRAHEESATKAKRLKAAWVGKRERAQSREVQTTRVPAWIQAEGSGAKDRRDAKLALIPDRAAIVRNIFDWYVNGMGKDQIARRLNREGTRTWGAGKGRSPASEWRSSYIYKLLRSPAVYGSLVPHTDEYDAAGKRRRTPQQEIERYYPAAIDRAMYLRAQTMIASRRGSSANRGIASLVAGLATCPKCGARMTRMHKGKRAGPPKLVCTKAKNHAGCLYRTVALPNVEAAVVGNADVLSVPPYTDETLGDQIRAVRDELHDLGEQIESLVDEIEKRPSAALSKRLATREAQAEKLRTHYESLQEQAAQTESRVLRLRAQNLSTSLKWYRMQPKDVDQANAAMRECFSEVVVDYEDGMLKLRWRQGGETELPFLV